MQNYLTGENLLVFVLFLLALCWAGNMLFQSQQNYKKAKAEQAEPINKLTARVEAIEGMLANDKHRLEQHEAIMSQMQSEAKEQREQSKLVMIAVKALLNHGIHNGNSDEMETAAKEIDDYLLRK